MFQIKAGSFQKRYRSYNRFAEKQFLRVRLFGKILVTFWYRGFYYRCQWVASSFGCRFFDPWLGNILSSTKTRIYKQNTHTPGKDPGFFLGGGALVSCSTSTPINHIVFFPQNTSCIRKPQVISGGAAHPLHLPLDPPLYTHTQSRTENSLFQFWLTITQTVSSYVSWGNEKLLKSQHLIHAPLVS